MEQNKSNFAIPAEQRQKWYSIALVWIGAMICVSSLMVGGMLGSGMKLGTCALTIVVGYGIVCIYMCFMGMQGCDTGLPTAVMAGGSLGEKGGKYVISAILALACIGWFGIQAAVCGASFSAMMESMTGLAIPAWLSSIIWGIIMVASASFGFKGLKWLNYIAVPLLIIVLIYGLVVTMITHDGAAAIAAYEPAQPLTLLSGINITVGSFAIGGSLAGDYCRFAKNRADVIKSSVVGVLPSGLLILLIGAVLSILMIRFLNKQGLASYRDALFHSANPAYHGLISLLCGALTLVLCTVWYMAYGKKHGFSFRNTGIAISGHALLKSIGAALLAVFALILMVFAVDYFVDVNFLIVYWGFMKFGANRIPGMLLVVPMYLVYYIVMSISVNSFNFSTALGKNKLLSNLLISFIASVPTLFILCYVYGIFKATGSNPMFGGLASAATAVYALPGFIFVAILICRLLYQHTGNPYLGGIFCGVLAAVSEWGICEIRVHTPGTQYAGTALVYALIAIGFVVTIACAVLLKKNNAAVQAHK